MKLTKYLPQIIWNKKVKLKRFKKMFNALTYLTGYRLKDPRKVDTIYS